MKIEPFALERWMTTHELHVDYDIAESGIFPWTLRELLELLPPDAREETLDHLLDLRLGYNEATGTAELRNVLAGTYQGATRDNILVTTGAIEANFLLFNVLLEPGDHVIAPYPAYQQLYSVPRALGCDVTLWHIRPETGFRYSAADLEPLLQPNTKLIVINSPHNPTGAMLSPADLQRVYDLAESVGAHILSDEAYRWLAVPGGGEFAPPAFELGPLGISVGTLSKPFGLPGLRLGWIAAPAAIAERCWHMRDYVSLSPGKLNDALAILALTHRRQMVERNARIIAANLETAQRWFAAHAGLVSWLPPRGGLLALLRYELEVPSLELADRLAREYSVMLAPGSAFGYEGYLRIGIGQDPPLLAAGLERAGECLAAVAAEQGA